MASRTAYSTWTPQKPTLFSGHYLRNCSTLDIGVLGYIGIVQHKEHSPEVLSIPPGTPCILPKMTVHVLQLVTSLLAVTEISVWCHWLSSMFKCTALDTKLYQCTVTPFTDICQLTGSESSPQILLIFAEM